MPARHGVAWLLATVAVTGVAAPDPADVLIAASGDRQLLVMPAAAPLQASPVPGVEVAIADEGAFRVYRASHLGRTYTVRTLTDGPPRRFAFDPDARRFAELAPLLRVRLSDPDRLPEVAADAGATRHWDYPAFGWAFLRLPEDVNPAAVARRLADHPLVERADVQLAEPAIVPQ